jgi:hypothetical protein
MKETKIAKIQDPEVRTIIANKFPQGSWNFSDMNSAPELTMDFGTDTFVKELTDYFKAFKRNAAQAANGFSTDQIQDLIKYCPDVMKNIATLVGMIIKGLVDDNNRNIMLRTRGIPLMKDDKLRPISVQCPFYKAAAHYINREYRDKILEICTDNQLGGPISGGLEILIHTVRAILELKENWLCVKTDIENAYNSISREQIFNELQSKLPELTPFVSYSIGKSNSIVYNDSKEGITFKVEMSSGVCQGDPISESLFNITQAARLKAIRDLHPEIILLSYHDDHFILGEPDYVLSALKTFDVEMEKIALVRSKTKSEGFSFGNTEINVITDLRNMGVRFIEKDLGILVGGTPIGTMNIVQMKYTKKWKSHSTTA